MENDANPNAAGPSSKQSKIVLIVILVIAAIAIAVAAAMIFANPTIAPTTTQNETTGSTPSTDASNAGSSSEMATITFTNSGFSPSKLSVKKGTKVTVVNKSSSPVQFSSGSHPTHREDPEINMSELAPGESGSFTVKTTGSHSFHDHLDDSKTGTLIVTE